MIDLAPAPVPDLSDEWIASHRQALIESLSQPHRNPTRWVALAGASGIAATVSSILLVGGSQPYAFAGWSAAPTAPSSGQLSAADTTCQARMAQAAQDASSNTGPGPDAASLVPKLSDVRGPYTVTVFGNGGPGGALCISAPNATSLRWIKPSDATVGPAAIVVDQVSVLARDSEPYTLVEGRTGVGVTAVSLTLGNGSEVLATSGDGIFVAWWPGSQAITSATITTPNGVLTQTLNLPGPNLPTPSKSAESQTGTMANQVLNALGY